MGRAQERGKSCLSPITRESCNTTRTSPTNCSTRQIVTPAWGCWARSPGPFLRTPRESYMNHYPYQSASGVLFAPVATDLPAGLRSLILKLNAPVPPRLGRWTIPVRLAVSAACFVGGFACARAFVDCVLRDPGACPCFVPPAPSPVALVLGLAVLFAVFDRGVASDRRVDGAFS